MQPERPSAAVPDGADRRDTFDKTWQALNASSPPIDLIDIARPIGAVARAVDDYFAREDATEFFIIADLTAPERAELERAGLHIDRLRMNLELSIRANGSGDDDRRRFQLDAIEHRRLIAICPFSGAVVTSQTSIPVTRETVFYRFTGAEVFYIATNHLGGGFGKGALYFPARNMVIKVNDFVWELRREHIVKLKALMVSNAAAVAAYMNDTSPRAGLALCLGDSNYAHHLWNELSGLLRLSRARLLRKVNRLYVFREPLGPLPRMFAHIAIERIRHIEASSDVREYLPAAVVGEMLERHYFIMNVGDDYIAEDLVRHVRRNYAVLPAAVKKEIRSARRAHWPLVFLSIRTGNRTWNEQGPGLATVLIQLAKRYPNLGAVIDGYSLGADYTTEVATHPWIAPTGAEELILVEEAEIIREMQELLRSSSVTCYPISGRSVLEAAMWAANADFYVTHAGSNQHKPGWLGNIPGIVHSNTSVLNDPPKYYHTVREAGIAPTFLASRYVREASDARIVTHDDLRDNLANYTVDVEHLTLAVTTMATMLARRRSGLRAIGYRGKRIVQALYGSRGMRDLKRTLKRACSRLLRVIRRTTRR